MKMLKLIQRLAEHRNLDILHIKISTNYNRPGHEFQDTDNWEVKKKILVLIPKQSDALQ